MTKKQSLELIEKLSNAYGVSGFEHDVSAIAQEYAAKYANISKDAMCNTFIKPNVDDSKPTLMLDAHLDEVGFMIQAIKPNGTASFVTVGGWVPANVTAERVRIKNRDGQWIPGIIATKPPHYMTPAERKQPVEIANLVVDFGTVSADETIKLLKVNTGCHVVPDVTWEYNEKLDIMMGKAFDNRIGTAVVLTAIERLTQRKEKMGVNVVGALAAQEEVGCRGAKVTVRKIKPDIAICLDGCPADDTFTPDWLVQTGMKRGPMLRDMDTTFIATPAFQSLAVATAEENNIPYTRAVRTGGGVNASELLVYEGIPTICIGIPVRYEHTHHTIVAYEDFQNTVDLVVAIVEKLNTNVISEF
ncbi:M42 family metallopeptidase [Liquorilactobacillus mali]|uniref:Glutamyl aminopeptidase n=1 Tax=Liquorilactobacillus mali KCTC 3596 = DSM 20444 TaxID=1046596 RepID=A0A0R2E288_9LACO|nr:M20/M25/M40 family metallo-hydrolase [Liquorilactobacillus mali]KRN10393.1 glutamyl aminopeptidase [Liquorilactobacillus mali KCTC 3596 = DSM 20444]QFQ74623.1 M42 family metallopeptidase [Liquorilactobacillus mali]